MTDVPQPGGSEHSDPKNPHPGQHGSQHDGDVVDPALLPPAPGVLDQPLGAARITGLSAGVAAKLAKGLDARTLRDLLELIPRRYIDLSRKRSIGDLKIGEEATTTGKIVRVDGRHLRSRRHLLTVTISDGTGYLDLVWWNQPFRARAFTQGATVAVAGTIERGRGRLLITNPFVEPIGSGPGVHVGRIIPVHPATQGVTANQIRRFVHDALKAHASSIEDPLPEQIREAFELMPRRAAIEEMHFPTSQGARSAARKRLAFEELFVLSTGLAVRKHRLTVAADGLVQRDEQGMVDRFLASLPFDATGAQRRAIEEVAADMERPQPMNRLLQGEVGSGKTVVAVAAALIASAAGSQVAFMAPTEVLAEQHYLTVRRLLEPLREHAPPQDGRLFGGGFEVALLTGSVTGKDRERALEMAASGEAMMLVGTHALIQEGVAFDRLGLAIVDEQHRFGVHQRIALRGKARGGMPDVLIMTATPIPRTLTLTLYGDLDVSVLDEMPRDRLPVETRVVTDDRGRAAAYEDVREQVALGHQAFIICPLVEDSPSLEVKAAETEFERIKSDVFPELRVGLIHGRMRPAAKEQIMTALRAGEVDILVSTTVVEVGVDIPNATVMIIEDAERFGLSQLHQLRGRIGRGSAASRCYLFTTMQSDDTSKPEGQRRLAAMARSSDGFELAELDLEIRGGGQLFGRNTIDEAKGAPAQAGRGDLKFANLLRDVELLMLARQSAFELVATDPALRADKNEALSQEVRRRFADRLDWLFAS